MEQGRWQGGEPRPHPQSRRRPYLDSGIETGGGIETGEGISARLGGIEKGEGIRRRGESFNPSEEINLKR